MECDICSEPADSTFTVTADGRTVVADLCRDHALPLELVMEIGSTSPRDRDRPTPKPPPTHQVRPFEW